MTSQEAIVAAVQTKDVAQIEALLQQDPTLVQTRTPDGSLVLSAVYRGATDVLQVLLRYDPPLDIFEAAAVGSVERIEALIANDPALVQAANGNGFMPLGLAAFFGRAQAVRALLTLGAEINCIMQSKVPYVPSNTALHAAVAGGPHREAVEVLVGAGADVNALDSNGHTPLHSAAFNNDGALVAYLVAHGADPNRRGEGALTPRAYALKHGKEIGVEAIRVAGGVE